MCNNRVNICKYLRPYEKESQFYRAQWPEYCGYVKYIARKNIIISCVSIAESIPNKFITPGYIICNTHIKYADWYTHTHYLSIDLWIEPHFRHISVH